MKRSTSLSSRPVDRRPREAADQRRDVLELVGEQARDLDLDVIDVADEEADLPIARQREQRALAEEGQRLRVGFDLHGRDVGLARQVAADALHALLDRDVQVAADRGAELEAVRRPFALFGRHVGQRDGGRDTEDVLADLARGRASRTDRRSAAGCFGCRSGSSADRDRAGEAPARRPATSWRPAAPARARTARCRPRSSRRPRTAGSSGRES